MLKIEAARRVRGGAMGLAITDDILARTISLNGGQGTTSVEGIDHIAARRLQDGDPSGSIRRTIDEFENRFDAHETADFIRTLYVPGGVNGHYRKLPMFGNHPDKRIEGLAVFAGYWAVRTAKMGRFLNGPDVRIIANKLEEVQTPVMATTMGMLLAGVDEIEISAGMPFQMRDNIRRLCGLEPVRYNLDVHHGIDEQRDQIRKHQVAFNPRRYIGRLDSTLREPMLTGVASSNLAFRVLTDPRRHPGAIDQVKVEFPEKTGGHTTKPKNLAYNNRGEYEYGPRDKIDLDLVKRLATDAGVTFTLAGGYSTPERVAEAIEAGADSVTVATIFQYCKESGLPRDAVAAQIRQYLGNNLDVFNDPNASPTGYSFRVVRNIEGIPSIGDAGVYEDWDKNHRDCTIGRLRERITRRGRLDWRCKAEPVADYVRKGGKVEDTIGAVCMCEMLLAAVGIGQTHTDGYSVPPLFSAGTDMGFLQDDRLMQNRTSYSARDVIQYLTSMLR